MLDSKDRQLQEQLAQGTQNASDIGTGSSHLFYSRALFRHRILTVKAEISCS